MIKFGVIGLGIGERHLSALVDDERVLVEVVCDLDINKATKIASRYDVSNYCADWRELVDSFELDAVIVATYDHDHAEQIIQFLKHNVHIFIEKPLCTTIEELDAIELEYTQANNRSSLLVSSNFILRREKRFVTLKERIMSGELGSIYSVEASYDYGRINKILEGWRGTSPNYSVMNGGGIHMIDLCQWLISESFAPLYAIQNKVVTKNSPFKAPDFTSALGKLGKDAIFKVTANFGSQTPHFHQLKIYGTKGTFINDCAQGTYYFGHEPNVIKEIDQNPFPCANKGDLLPNFVDAIIGKSCLDINFKDVSSVMRTSLQIDLLAVNSEYV
ncbi:MAG: Gfo/Idh/MocA family oxidoreductase [Oceanospirillaceae bacterium]|nr:Gfo/Idh/MocA family oxidoreductase [Oceanospirillaceae bacterium]